MMLAGCVRDSVPERTFPGGHVLRESKHPSKPDTVELSVWKLTEKTELLVCRIVAERGKVVSIMPTPVQTDAIREMSRMRLILGIWRIDEWDVAGASSSASLSPGAGSPATFEEI